jgi:putative transposase
MQYEWDFSAILQHKDLFWQGVLYTIGFMPVTAISGITTGALFVLDEIVQTRRNTKSAKRLLVRLLKKQGLAPKRIITDKLRTYGAAKRQVMPEVEHRSHKGLNNRAENSYMPLRKRERMMQGFRSPGGLQRIVSIFSAIRNLFVSPRISRSALQIHLHRLNAMAERKAVTLTLV